MHYVIGCATDRGNYKEKNQDSVICIKQKIGNRSIVLVCICDGVGSFKNSEVASKLVVEGMERWLQGITTHCPKDMPTEDIIIDLEESIYELNEIICEYRVRQEEDLGCAMSIVAIIENEYYIFHAGDTRIFSLKEKIMQLTQDHSVLKDINGKEKRLLCNYMGKRKDFFLEKKQGILKKRQMLFLATDGVYSKVVEQDLLPFKYVREDEKAYKLCYQLLHVIMQRGEKDNLSCAIIGIR